MTAAPVSLGQRLSGIDEQVQDHSGQTTLVDQDASGSLDVAGQHHSGRQGGPQDGPGGIPPRHEVDPRRPGGGVAPDELPYRVGELLEGRGAAPDRPDRSTRLLRQIGPVQQDERHTDGRQKVGHVMGQSGGKVADGGHPLRLAHRGFHLPSLRDVSDDPEVDVQVPHRNDGQLRRKQSAVLALGRQLPHGLGCAVRDLRGVRIAQKPADGVPHDGIDVVAEHSLRRPVDGFDESRRIGDHHRVHRCVDDRHQALLVRARLLLRAVMRRDVLDDHHGAADRPVLGPQRQRRVEHSLALTVERLDVDQLVQGRLALDGSGKRPFLGRDALAGIRPPASILTVVLHADQRLPTPYPAPRGIPMKDPALGIGEPHPDRKRLHHGSQRLLALPQLRRPVLALGDVVEHR